MAEEDFYEIDRSRIRELVASTNICTCDVPPENWTIFNESSFG